MAESAQVIDLSEVRRQRAERAMGAVPSTAAAPALMPPMAWMPMWFFLPVWIGPAPLATAIRV